MNKLIAILALCVMPPTWCAAQQAGRVNIHARVVDDKTNTPLEYTSVYVGNDDYKYSAISDENGRFVIAGMRKGTYRLFASFVGYEKLEQQLHLNSDTTLILKMSSHLTSLEEVVVTASESRGLTSSSVIDRKAMQHLQPSSFSDLLELVPGGTFQDPVLNTASLIRIREVGGGSDYNSSLGTSFLVDGIPLSTNANMQYVTGYDYIINGGYANDGRLRTVNRGVDMRSLSTDQIERVEIIRGIPSVKYGDLTEGLVKIERKKGASPFEARFKADGISKLFALSKGFDIGNETILNTGVDFLDSKSEPTNSFENYQRLNATVRLNRDWHQKSHMLKWNANFDFAHTLDDEKSDPDAGYTPTDRYKSTYNRFALSNHLKWVFNESSFIKSFELLGAASYEADKIQQTKLVQLTEPTAIPNTTEQGVSDGIYLPAKWVSKLTVDGQPLNLFAQASGTFGVKTFGNVHNLLAGVEWNYDKNLGDGQVYDVTLPPSPEMTTRPRTYSDIPANQILSFFIEDAVAIPIGGNLFSVNAGIRSATMLGLDTKYSMHGVFYFDPRLNAQWTFPGIAIKDETLDISLSGGVGWHSKTPTLSQLYPDFSYNDLVQLNYYHNNPDYRRINIMTYKNKVINYELKPARNRKWEIRLNVSYDNNNLSVTYFREKKTNGFRSQRTFFQSQEYKKYDIGSVDPGSLTAPPKLEDMTYTLDTLLTAYSSTTNGSSTSKEGIEFMFSSKRIELLKTRVTINGAWFRSNYDNSMPAHRGVDRVINNRRIREIGVYRTSSECYLRQTFSTNVMFDTYIPVLDLEFSTSFQSTWFTMRKNKEYSGTPYAYIDVAGVQHPYTEKEKEDIYLRWLNIPVSETQFQTQRIPFGMNVNFKMSKNFKDRIRVSLFVNRMLDYHPDYTVNGHTYRRSVSPYFGAELNLKL